jgi:hypothetical protein
MTPISSPLLLHVTLLLLVLLLGRRTKSFVHELVSRSSHLLWSRLLGTPLLGRHLLYLVLQCPH